MEKRKFSCIYIVSSGHSRYLLDSDRKVMIIDAVDAVDAFQQFKELVETKTTMRVTEFHTFYSVNANPKLYKDAHGWSGNVNYPVIEFDKKYSISYTKEYK